jgi:hypothetical protein
MKLRFWRKDPEPAPDPPPPWAGLTPTADMTEMMIAMEWPATHIVWTLRCIELRRRIAELGQRVTELETALAHARKTSAMPDKPRVNRPVSARVNRPAVNKANGRAAYMRQYMRKRRAKLRVVADNTPRDGDVA